MRVVTILRLLLLAVLALVIALVAVVKSVNVEHYRPMLAAAVQALTGRTMEIQGRVALRLSLRPSLIADDLRLANMPGGSQPQMLTIRRVEAEISLLRLLWREVRIQSLTLEEPVLLLEHDPLGRGNWEMQAGGALPADDGAGLPTRFEVGVIRLKDAHVQWRQGEQRFQLDLDRLTLQTDRVTGPISLSGRGKWNGAALDVSGLFDPFERWLGHDAASRVHPVKLKLMLPSLVAAVDGGLRLGAAGAVPELVKMQLTADTADLTAAGRLGGLALPSLGAGRVSAQLNGRVSALAVSDIDAALGRKDVVALTIRGKIGALQSGHGVDLLLSADGDSVGAVNQLLGQDLLPPLPVKMTARLADLAPAGWRIFDLKAISGTSDIGGEILLRQDGAVPQLLATLHSARLDVGAAAVSGGGAAGGKSVSTAAETAAAAGAMVFPATALPLPLPGLVQGDVLWRVGDLRMRGLSLQDVVLSAGWHDSRAVLRGRAAKLAGGRAALALTLDARRQPVGVRLDAAADGVEWGNLLLALAGGSPLEGGRGALRLTLSGEGDTLAALLARASGEMLLVLDGGRPRDGVVRWLNAGLPPGGQPWPELGGDPALSCLAGRWLIRSGLARSEALLFDAGRLRYSGRGSINLANEQIDMSLQPMLREGNGTAPVTAAAVPGKGGAVPAPLPLLDVGGSLLQPLLAVNKGVMGRAALLPGQPGTVLPTLGDAGNGCVAALQASARMAALSATGAKDKKASAGKAGTAGRTESVPPPETAADLWRDLFRDGP